MKKAVEPAGASPNGHRDGADEARGLAIAMLLAALAGMVDAIGYIHLGGPFVSFMTGNTTELGVALGQSELARAGFLAELIALFVLGAVAGQVLAGYTGKWHMMVILIGVAVLLGIAAVLAMTPEPMVFAMGALNASIHRAGHISVSITYVTGMLVRFGQGLGDFLTRRLDGWSWAAQASPWVGLIAGAVVGGAAYQRIGEAAIWIPISLAGLLSACSTAISPPD